MAGSAASPGGRLRGLLNEAAAASSVVHAPGVYDAVTALLAARAGFTAMHLSGAIVSATRLGVPDLGYVTGADIAEVAGVVARAVPDACLVADADTGYGNALHVQRTVEAYARAGAAALHLEDQVFPKRCGHMAGKAVVPLAEAAGKVRAAVEAAEGSGLVVIARTDSLSVDGLAAAVERVKAYADAGADLVFVEGAADEATLDAVRSAYPDSPGFVLNRSEADPRMRAIPDAALASYGVRLVIHPVGAMLAALRATRAVYSAIAAEGSALSVERATWDDLTGLLGQPELLEAEQRFAADDDEGANA